MKDIIAKINETKINEAKYMDDDECFNNIINILKQAKPRSYKKWHQFVFDMLSYIEKDKDNLLDKQEGICLSINKITQGYPDY